MGTLDDHSLTLKEVFLQNENSEASTGDGTLDVHGKPALKTKTGSWKACVFILGSECCERLVFSSVDANLVTYLIQKMHQGNATAARLANTWSGTSYLTPLIGALIADSYLGRYWTIAASSLIYIIAMCALTLSASVPALKPSECVDAVCPSPTPFQFTVLFVGLYLMAVGTGGIKPCMPSFGADQFDQTDTKERISKGSFFNWLFFCMCFGALVSSSLLVWIQENVGWGIGYGISGIFMAIAVASFLSGTPFYRFQRPASHKSPLTSLCQVVVASCWKFRLEVPQDSNLLYENHDTRSDLKLEHTKGLHFLNKAAVLTDDEMKRGDFSDGWRLCSVTQTETLKILIRLFPIWATGIIDCAIHAQAPIFIEQGMVMGRRVGSFTIPAASLATTGMIASAVWVPIYDKLLVPLIRRFTGRERGITELQRIGIGLFLSTLTIMYAALLEMRRLQLAKELGLVNQNVAVPLNILWQVPQHVILGISNVFVYVGRLELFNDQPPEDLRSLCSALCLLTIAVGCYFSSLVLTIVAKVTTAGGKPGWIPDNLNEGRLDVYFWFWGGLSCLNLLVYVLCSISYKQKKVSKTRS